MKSPSVASPAKGRLKFQLIAIAICACSSTPVIAEIEKTAFLCGQQMCFRWWPKVQVVQGWQHDSDQSLNYNFNALSPVGQTFATAEAVMYANAIYKPRVPQEKTLAAFIESDLAKFRKQSPGLKITQTSNLKTADGKSAIAYLLKPESAGQWERVAYFEEGDYYMVFVASSRSESGLVATAMPYEALVSSYREKP